MSRRVSGGGGGGHIGRMPYAALDQLLFEGPHGGSGAGSDAGLVVDVLDVMADGLHGDAEGVADCLVGLAADELEQYLELAWR